MVATSHCDKPIDAFRTGYIERFRQKVYSVSVLASGKVFPLLPIVVD
jgi:hypothetical protein